MPHQFTCISCGNEFSSYRSNRRYCSRDCRDQSNHRLDEPKQPSITNICLICQRPFTVTASASRERQTCSRPCGNLWKSRKAQIPIEQRYGMPIKDLLTHLYYGQKLGVKAIARTLQMSDHTAWNWLDELAIPRRERSEAVANQWTNETRRKAQSQRMSTTMMAIVSQPGYETPSKRPDVAAKISKAKMGPGNAMYGKLGPENPLWRGGVDSYRGKGWRSIRTQILRRDNYTCAKCGKQYTRHDLDVHHITPYRETKDNDHGNLMTLCKSCHGAVEYHPAIQAALPSPAGLQLRLC